MTTTTENKTETLHRNAQGHMVPESLERLS